MRLYYTGCSFWVHRQLVLPPIKIVWSLLLQVLFLTPAKISGLKFSTMSAWEFLLVCWGEKYNLWILFCSHARPIPFSRMNFSLLELNLNSNSAQMAIVLRHLFHSSQASRFIKLPKFKHFHTLNYLGLHLGKSLPLPASVSIQIYNMIFPRAENTACTTTGGTGERVSKSAPSSTRTLLASQNKPFQYPSKWAKGNSSSSADLFQSLTHLHCRLVSITGRELCYHFPGCVYKKGWSYTCPSFYIALGFYVKLHKIHSVSHRKKCNALKTESSRKGSIKGHNKILQCYYCIISPIAQKCHSLSKDKNIS